MYRCVLTEFTLKFIRLVQKPHKTYILVNTSSDQYSAYTNNLMFTIFQPSHDPVSATSHARLVDFLSCQTEENSILSKFTSNAKMFFDKSLLTLVYHLLFFLERRYAVKKGIKGQALVVFISETTGSKKPLA